MTEESEKRRKQIKEANVTRRSMLKWTAGLAAAGIVGVGIGYGASQMTRPEDGVVTRTTTATKTVTAGEPPPVSLKPPLSPEIQERVNKIIKDRVDRHAGQEVRYTQCWLNCGANGTCVLKVRLKDGIIQALEPDDQVHPNVGREDEVMTQEDFDFARFQHRGCAIGYSWHNQLYFADRPMYPLKRAPGTKRGEGKWVRISWNDFLDELVGTMKEYNEKYGPFFLFSPYSHNSAYARFAGIIGMGCTGYGACSDDAWRIMGPFTGGATMAGNSAPDRLKSNKLTILCGMTHTTTHFGTGYSAAWYYRMKREKGHPIIMLDPKVTWDVQSYGTQYIPIKPGTDTAMMMAMANVILKEGLYDEAYCEENMYGWREQSDYILGKGYNGPTTQPQLYDKIDKTPEWAEGICGVPAETIRELARLFAKTKPAAFQTHHGARRKSWGEETARIALYLNILTGNSGVNGVPGGGGDGNHLANNGSGPPLPGSLPGDLPGETVTEESEIGQVVYGAPTFYRTYHWWKAVTYANKVKDGEPSILYPGKKMTWDEWATLVGFNAYPDFVSMFEPRVAWMGGGRSTTNYLTMAENTNAQIKCLDQLDLIINAAGTHIHATCKYADIVFPITDYIWEETDFHSTAYGSFGNRGYVSGLSKRVGEAKSMGLFYAMVCEKLGGLPLAKKWFKYYTGADNWDQDWDRYMEEGYNTVTYPWMQEHPRHDGKYNPTWEQVKAAKSSHDVMWRNEEYNPLEVVHYEKGTKPRTRTGKVEIMVDTFAGVNEPRGQEHFDYRGNKYAHCPNDWRDMEAIGIYHPCYNGMEDVPRGRLQKYPLMVLSPHSIFRIHYMGNDVPQILEAHRHSIHINPADAKVRGIRDNDWVSIWNDQGRSVARAFVTNRESPGVVHMRTGMDFDFTKSGLDVGGCVNIFTGGDDNSPISPSKVTNNVQIERYGVEIPGQVY